MTVHRNRFGRRRWLPLMGYPPAPWICLNPRMRPSYLAHIAQFVTVYLLFYCGLTAQHPTGMRETAVICCLGVSAEVL